MRRRSIVPFFVGSKRVANLADLKNVLSENPAALLEPLRDGRLKRFLAGLGERYVNCLNYDSPEESLKALGREIGIELEGALNLEESGAVVSSGDEILRLLSSDEEEIVLPSGTIFFEKLVIDRPVKIIGQGRNTTVLKCNVLEILSEGVIFEGILCEVDVFLPRHFPKLISSYFSFKTSISSDLSFARGVEILKDGDFIEFKPKILEIEISNPVNLTDKEVFFRDVKFVIKDNGNLNFKNSTCSILNCYFEGKADFLIEDSYFSIEKSVIEGISLKLTEGSKIRAFSDSFFHSEKSLILLDANVEAEIDSCEFKENKIGIWVDRGAKLKVVASKFKKHENSNGEGTGIVCFHNSIVEVDACQFTENENGIRLKSDAKLKIRNSEFKRNENFNGEGAGIVCFHNSTAKIDSCWFIENQRDIKVESSAELKVMNSKFEKNKNYDAKGVGLICFNDSSVQVISCQFVENGIWIEDNANLKVKSSKFEKHKSHDGEGSGILCLKNSVAEVSECEFNENQVDIVVKDNANLEIRGSFIEVLIIESCFVNISTSKIKLIKYKGENKKPVVQNSVVDNWQDISGCFITTATCLSLGKGDNCYELNTFRKFRDEWLLKQPGGEKLVEEYYTVAPLIVESINSLPEKHKVYATIWSKYLKECLKLIENGKYEKAKALYLTMVTDLKGRFLT